MNERHLNYNLPVVLYGCENLMASNKIEIEFDSAARIGTSLQSALSSFVMC
jgi:hypothetical protein